MDLKLYIDSGKFTSRFYDKRDDFNFPIVNFPFLDSNIPFALVYGVYISQLIELNRAACSEYQDFFERGRLLTIRLLTQRHQRTKLVSALKKFYGRHHDLVPTMWLHPDVCLWFCHSQATNRLSKPRTLLFPFFPKSLFRLMGEALFLIHVCLSVMTFLILFLCISIVWFSEIRYWHFDLRHIQKTYFNTKRIAIVILQEIQVNISRSFLFQEAQILRGTKRRKNDNTKTGLYIVDPLKLHFYIVKLGFTGYTLFFLFLLKTIDVNTR